jgi:hypothetical protein
MGIAWIKQYICFSILYVSVMSIPYRPIDTTLCRHKLLLLLRETLQLTKGSLSLRASEADRAYVRIIA